MRTPPNENTEQTERACFELCRLFAAHPDYKDELWMDLLHRSRDLPGLMQASFYKRASQAGIPEAAAEVIVNNNTGAAKEGSRDIDIVVYVALAEEFLEFFNLLVRGFRYDLEAEEASLLTVTLYYCNIGGYKVAIINSGSMGSDRAAGITGHIQSYWPTADSVVIGIAGATSTDLLPGDVFIPSVVKGYMENSAAEKLGEGYEIKTSGKECPCNQRLVDRFRNFPTSTDDTRQERYASLMNSATERRNAALDETVREKLMQHNLDFGRDIRIIVGEDMKLASGPTVGKAEAFCEWVTDTDRKVAALEMESLGPAIAGALLDPPPRLVVIRGISDIADSRKEALEDISKGELRQAALQNAVEVFVAGVESGFFSKS